MSRVRLILASASPRRRELLTWAGVDHQVWPVRVDESVRPDESPADYALRLARTKAEEAAADFPGEWILAADTIVVLDGRIMGKPGDRIEAAQTLRTLSGRIHEVLTAFCLINQGLGRQVLDHVRTEVEFRVLSEKEIEGYIDSGEVWDKAGAYGIQGRGGALVRNINGSYTNVVGLPLAEVLDGLGRCGL